MSDEKRDQFGALYGQLTDETSRRLRNEASEAEIEPKLSFAKVLSDAIDRHFVSKYTRQTEPDKTP